MKSNGQILLLPTSQQIWKTPFEASHTADWCGIRNKHSTIDHRAKTVIEKIFDEKKYYLDVLQLSASLYQFLMCYIWWKIPDGIWRGLIQLLSSPIWIATVKCTGASVLQHLIGGVTITDVTFGSIFTDDNVIILKDVSHCKAVSGTFTKCP